ncbi:MAG: hypothetical protein AB7N24_02455 [Dehalococcoidia bacterium]
MPRYLLAAIFAVVAIGLVACEKPDASYVTSPTLKTLIGTTTGNVAFNPAESAPEEKDPPDKWQVEFGLARWAELENGQPALQIVAQVATHPGAGFELWLDSEGKTVARWSAGSTTTFVGTVCFQLELEKDGERVPLGAGPHTATMVFRDPSTGVIAAQKLQVTNFIPKLTGADPGPESEVFREALACPRGQ